ncbi:MAG: CDP-glycerol glycerophosphotransferase family protein [Paludibacteraceae bacterium]|nr:CDP-glycerol glycerophosphotransferase family protein [Paludibacteraceae bacterium]
MPKSLIFWTIQNRSFKEIVERVCDLLGYLLIPLACIMHRNNKLWVFGNKTGFSDNSKYLFLYIIRNMREIKAIWIARSKEEQKEIASLQLPCYYKWSLRGINTCLKAGIYCFSSSTSDINYWTSARAIKINLWHGVGIKKLGLKGSFTYNPQNRLNKFLTPSNYDPATFFITTSDLMDEHFRECYALTKEQTRQIGYPRCDFLVEETEIVDEYIEKYENDAIKAVAKSLEQYSKVYIYMPTFRDDQSDYISHSGIAFQELNEMMIKNNAMFLIKLHPATRTKVTIDGYSNIMLLNKDIDVYPLLPKTDVLITDYSSIYYDYQLMPGKHIILYPFDYEDYIKNSRDLAYDYDTYTPGEKVHEWNRLKQVLADKNLQIETNSKWVIEQLWGSNYTNASQKIIDLV